MVSVSLEARHMAANQLRDLGILSGQLHRGVDHQTSHPSLRAQQIAHEPVEIRANLGHRRSGTLQRPHLLWHDQVLAARNGWLESGWLADQGFAVIVADGRGTPGRGRAWACAVDGDLAGPVLEDQILALRELASENPQLDLRRVAIRSWSFGGYLAALAVLRRPEVFHAAVAGAPVTEWRLYDTHYAERYLGSDPDGGATADRDHAYDAAGISRGESPDASNRVSPSRARGHVMRADRCAQPCHGGGEGMCRRPGVANHQRRALSLLPEGEVAQALRCDPMLRSPLDGPRFGLPAGKADDGV